MRDRVKKKTHERQLIETKNMQVVVHSSPVILHKHKWHRYPNSLCIYCRDVLSQT